MIRMPLTACFPSSVIHRKAISILEEILVIADSIRMTWSFFVLNVSSSALKIMTRMSGLKVLLKSY